MDVFEYELDNEKEFSVTNKIWNKLKLNSKESVGVIVDLINSEQFPTKEDWLNYYYKHGRTKEQLMEVAKKLFDAVGSELNLSLDDCFYMTEFRVIKQSWNGIAIREENTVKKLRQEYPHIDFRKTDGLFDDKYAVDFEAYHNDTLLCGIQVKPESYSYVSLGTLETNKQKNKEYYIDFYASVYTIISSLAGEIRMDSEYGILMRKFFSLKINDL